MENIKVYMLSNEVSRGLNYSAGYIYEVKQHIAEEMEESGKAKRVNFRKLDEIDKRIEQTVAVLKSEIERVESDRMLSDEGKTVKNREFLQATEEQIEAFGSEYDKEIERLMQEAQKKASQTERQAGYNADEVKENVGVIITDVAMSPSFLHATEVLKNQLEFMDQATARRLLSQFTEVKKELEEKGHNVRGADRYIRNLYEDIKAAAETEAQVVASLEYRMIKAIEQSRISHYPPSFKFIKKRIS